MTSTDLCKMCTEYSIHSKCEYRKTCKLQKILTENKDLKAKNKELKAKVEELEVEKSWHDFSGHDGKVGGVDGN